MTLSEAGKTGREDGRCCCGRFQHAELPQIINDTVHEELGPTGNFCGPIINHELRDTRAELSALRSKYDALLSLIAQSVPFLEEAWEACFDGKKEKLLSAEERGMADILMRFRAIRDGKPALPPGVYSSEEHEKSINDAIGWAHRLLGNPNELKPELRRWINLGETCVDGIERVSKEYDALRETTREELKSSFREAHGSLEECEDPECMICGIIECPHDEPLHFHHDGCPDCYADEVAKSAPKVESEAAKGGEEGR